MRSILGPWCRHDLSPTRPEKSLRSSSACIIRNRARTTASRRRICGSTLPLWLSTPRRRFGTCTWTSALHVPSSLRYPSFSFRIRVASVHARCQRPEARRPPPPCLRGACPARATRRDGGLRAVRRARAVAPGIPPSPAGPLLLFWGDNGRVRARRRARLRVASPSRPSCVGKQRRNHRFWIPTC